MALWTFADLPATRLWYDALTRTVDVGVNQLTDKTGNDTHLTQATTSAQPPVSSAAVNGLDAILFDNSAHYLSNTPATPVAQTEFTLISVWKTGTPGTYQTPPLTLVASPYYGRPLERHHALGTNRLYINATYVEMTLSLRDATSVFVHTIQMKKDGAAAGVHTVVEMADGVVTTSTTVNTGWETASQQIRLGLRPDGATVFNGLFCESALIEGELSTEDLQSAEGYLAWRWGTVSRLQADHPYKSAAPESGASIVSLLAVLVQEYSLVGNTIQALLKQPYSLATILLTKFEQLYGLQLLVVLTQHYGDMPVVRQYLEQYYGSADLLRRLLIQPYGNALQLRQSLVENWNLPGDLLAIMEMRYSISEGDLRALMSYNYDLSEYTLLRQKLEQIYIAGPDAEEAQEPLFYVTTNNGESLKPHHINIEIDEGEYAIKGEIHLADQNDFLLCKHIETEIIIPIDSTEYHLLVEGPRQSRPEWGRVEYYIPLASKTILLDSPYATPIDQEFTGALASVIVAGLAAIKSITVIWQLIDWYIPTGVLTANNESPLSIIRRIVNAVGGILQSSPAGELICLPEYPISTTEWETATPDFYLTDMDNFFSVDSTSDIREGYNRFLISDKVIDESGLTLEQVDIDENTKDIYVYQVPWNPLEQVILHTSGGVWVSIVAEGIITEERTEIVEIIAGEGMTQKPFYNKISHDYKETELGLITINEDKTVSTELSQNSLVEVIYNTKYWKFRVRDAEIEKVQFFPEAIAI